MVGKLYLLIGVACVFLAGGAAGQSQCTAVSWGDLTTNLKALPPAYLEPGVVDWNVQIPSPPDCNYGVSGILATACDHDKAPSPSFLQKSLLFVHRNGDVQERGIVHVNVFCNRYPSSRNVNPKLDAVPWESNWYKSVGLGAARN